VILNRLVVNNRCDPEVQD